MELKDIAACMGVFYQFQPQIQEAADQAQSVHTFWALRGGTYEQNLDWFQRLCAQSPLDWRTTSRMALDELQRGHRVEVRD